MEYIFACINIHFYKPTRIFFYIFTMQREFSFTFESETDGRRYCINIVSLLFPILFLLLNFLTKLNYLMQVSPTLLEQYHWLGIKRIYESVINYFVAKGNTCLFLKINRFIKYRGPEGNWESEEKLLHTTQLFIVITGV